MAFAITKDGQVGINGYRYNLTSPLLETYLSPLPGKVNIGGDEYSKENYLSQWIQKDRRGGILIDEMDESIHSNRVWWTNLIISHDGHLTLPRKATAISALSATVTVPTIVNADMESATGTGWIDGQGTWTRDSTYAKAGTYSWWTASAQVDDYFYQDLTGFVPGATYTFTCWATTTAGGSWKIGLDDGLTQTFGTTVSTASAGVFEQSSVAKTIAVGSTRLRLLCWNVTGSKPCAFDVAAITVTAVTVGDFVDVENFNSELYAAFGRCLCKLASGRAGWTLVAYFATAIVRLVPSLNSTLAIFLGDSTNYASMATTELMTVSNSSAAYYGVLANGLLYKMNSTGTFASSANPESATPTWNNLADITTDTSKIEGLFRGRDSDGNFVVYCAMNTALMVYDATNDKWLPTELRLPDHPNGGKGATYWNDGHYLSYGLGVKKYTTGATASISEVGLERDGGLPVYYNGEIVKFCADSQYFLVAAVDASQTSGNSKSGLYVWTGMAWECWWADANNNAAMHDVVVSSAESGYAIYWDCGGAVYYIDIPRGIQNPKQLAGTQAYEAAGILISPWFDAGTAAFPNLITAVTSYARSVTTTETITIKYRTNHVNEDRDTGWTTLVTLDTTAENGAVETLLASGAGITSDAIQFRIDMARGSTTTLSPDLLALVTSYMLKKTDANNKAWSINIILDGEADNTSANDQYNNIWSALGAGTLIPFVFRSVSTPHYVQLFLTGSSIPTGDHWGGTMSLQAVEL